MPPNPPPPSSSAPPAEGLKTRDLRTEPKKSCIGVVTLEQSDFGVEAMDRSKDWVDDGENLGFGELHSV